MNREFRRRHGNGFNPQDISRGVPDLSQAPQPTPQQMQQMMLMAWREAGARVMVEVTTHEEGPLLLNVDHIVALTPTREIVLQNRRLTVACEEQWGRLMFWFFTGRQLGSGFEPEQKTVQQRPMGREEGQ